MILLITNAGLSKIASARIGGPKVSLTQFSLGFTSGTVDSTATSVPGQVYGLVAINSAFLSDANSAQYECVVPETVGSFDFNVLGLFDSSNDLIAIAKADNAIKKTASNLPTVIGNRIVVRAQLSITNADAVLNFTLNVLANANLNFVSTVASLSGLASVGLYKTYRVLTMPDGYSDIATSNGSNWTYGRYNPQYVGTSISTAADLTHVYGDLSKPFKSYHVNTIIEFLTGPNAGLIRVITAVDETNNLATISAVTATPQSGNSFLAISKDKVHGVGSVLFSNESGYPIDDTNLVFNSTNKRLGLRKDNPSSAYHQLGGGMYLQQLNTPSGPAINPQGSLGTTIYTYFIVAEDYEGKRTLPSNSGVTNSGNATLNGSNFNRITWTAVPGTKTYYILKSNTSTLLGSTTGLLLDDTGQSTSAFTVATRNETADLVVDGKVTAGQQPTSNLDLTTKQYVDQLINSLFGPGSLKIWPSNSIPTGFLVCDGSAVSRTTYADLFGVVGTSFGAGDGSTTFNLPDFKGRSPIGLGLSDAANAVTSFTLGSKYGEERHIQTVTELAAHSHVYSGPTGGNNAQGGSNVNFVGQNTSTTGSSTPFNVVHPVLPVNILIKT